MQIFVRGPANLLAFNIEKDDTLQDVYECIAQESGCVLNDIVVTTEVFPFDRSTIDAHVKVLGGKTHGRLNNAGKVKNATPKVAPTEKPKKKTGRARRREQYAHRFANKVVSPSGDRRGPNSNY
ncbi:unnamed protein product [Rotaria socialis]|uniref:40S ribosomal protein S30 n=1 Tax=Rotaria socialis TaxID=392032 RepID=A0A821K779_9BILA|nr:unnamed protein product [Rotaria socialis]CAF4731331.1 unnamed protein product [Rotaria socialis]